MIQYLEDDIDEEVGLDLFIEVGNKIGFKKSAELYHLINNSEIELDYSPKSHETWKNKIAQKLNIISNENIPH